MDIKSVSNVSRITKSEIPITKATEANKSDQIISESNVSEMETKKFVDEINKLFEHEKIHAEYTVHEGFGDIIIKIVDNETKQVIKEFPKEKVINMVRKLCDIAGIMIDQKV